MKSDDKVREKTGNMLKQGSDNIHKENVEKKVDQNKNKDNGNKGNGTTNVGDKTHDVVATVDAEGALIDEQKAEGPHTWKVPDGGWGWVVVVSAMVISLIVDGLTYTFGVFLGEFERAFKEPKSTISLASSIQVGLYLFIGPVVSALTNRFGCRPVIIAGSLIAGLAFIISSWSKDVTMLILTYGVVGGIGFGLMYLPAIVAVSIYFEERRAFATGIAVCGSGIGTFILAPLSDFLIYEFNWSWTLLILGGLILNGVVFGALVRPLELQRAVVDDRIDKARPSIQGEYDDKTLPVKMKVPPAYNSSNKLPSQTREEVPLLHTIDEKDPIISFPNTTETTERDKSKTLFFNSTPNMHNSSNPQLSTVATIDGNHNSSETFFQSISRSVGRPRSNTVNMLLQGEPTKFSSTSDKAVLSTPPRVRAHAPLGLAFISLSDADLNRIREDVNLPLSRKDIHLSGPLPFPESDPRILRDDKGQGLYVQNMKSLTSLASQEGLKEGQVKPRGFWSCLPPSARETLEEMLSLSILKDKRYWFVLMGNFFCMIGFYVPFVYVPDRAKQIGIEEDKAAFLLSIIGITNTVGRVMTGVVINFLNIDCVLVTTIALALAGVMTAVCPLCQDYASLAAVSAIFGVCVAAYISLCSVLLCELLGVENLTNAFGFVILFRGVACIMGPPIAGAIIDATGVYAPSFYIGGGTIVIGALCHGFLLIPFCRRKKPHL